MNARTGILSDMSNDDKFHVNSSVPPRHSICTTRNNCDQIINNNGLKLIDLCKSYDMQIANGRSRDDRWGNFTHFNKNKGESTVDMAILSDTMMKITNDFKVLPQPDYSDHCKIIITIDNLKTMAIAPKHISKFRQPQHQWNKNPDTCIKAFNDPNIKKSIDDCKECLEAGLIESSGKKYRTFSSI